MIVFFLFIPVNIFNHNCINYCLMFYLLHSLFFASQIHSCATRHIGIYVCSCGSRGITNQFFLNGGPRAHALIFKIHSWNLDSDWGGRKLPQRGPHHHLDHHYPNCTSALYRWEISTHCHILHASISSPIYSCNSVLGLAWASWWSSFAWELSLSQYRIPVANPGYFLMGLMRCLHFSKHSFHLWWWVFVRFNICPRHMITIYLVVNFSACHHLSWRLLLWDSFSSREYVAPYHRKVG